VYAFHVRGRYLDAGRKPFRRSGHFAYGPSLECRHCGASDTIPAYLTSDLSRRNAFLAWYRVHRECGDPDRPAVAWRSQQWDARITEAETVLAGEGGQRRQMTGRQLAAWMNIPLGNANQLCRIVRERTSWQANRGTSSAG
jgi:hypothetical protein